MIKLYRIPFGRYGARCCRYLKAHRPGLFARLLLSEQLTYQLLEVDPTVLRKMDILLPQMVTETGGTREQITIERLQLVDAMNTIMEQTLYFFCPAYQYRYYAKTEMTI